MKYTKEILEKVNLVNEVMHGINVTQLFENPDFLLDEMSIESWLKINLNTEFQNIVPLSFTFSNTGLEIRLDRIAEAIDWSNKDLKNSRTAVKTLIKNLLTSHILVEYYGSSYTVISLFNQDGKCTNRFKFKEFFLFKGKRENRLYHPIY